MVRKQKMINGFSEVGQNHRQSNIELFRIVTMLLIIAHHYVVNSGLTLADGPIFNNPASLRSMFLLVFGAWGKTGINCFVLISGYFMCKSHITAKKFAKLLGEILFYNVIINAAFWISGYSPFTIKGLIKALLPITSVGTGFTSAYLVFFLTIPFLNILINTMTEKQHIKLLLLLSFLYIVLGTVPFMSVTMNYVSWFVVLYFIAAYIRLYPKKLFQNGKFWLYASLVCIALSTISVVTYPWRCEEYHISNAYAYVIDSNTLLAVLTGVSTFMCAINIKLAYSKWINTIAASTFGVLLIHANSDAMRQWLWQDVLNNVGMFDSEWMPVHAIVSVLLVFVICTAIDYLRIKLIETPIFRVWDKYWPGIVRKYDIFEEQICRKMGIT